MSIRIINCITCNTEIQLIPAFMGDYIPSCRNSACDNFDKQGWKYFMKDQEDDGERRQ